jgi:hypothetical protein
MRKENLRPAVTLLEQYEKLDRLQLDLARGEDETTSIIVYATSIDSVGVEFRKETITPMRGAVRRLVLGMMERVAGELDVLGVFRPYPTIPEREAAPPPAAPSAEAGEAAAA